MPRLSPERLGDALVETKVALTPEQITDLHAALTAGVPISPSERSQMLQESNLWSESQGESGSRGSGGPGSAPPAPGTDGGGQWASYPAMTPSRVMADALEAQVFPESKNQKGGGTRMRKKKIKGRGKKKGKKKKKATTTSVTTVSLAGSMSRSARMRPASANSKKRSNSSNSRGRSGSNSSKKEQSWSIRQPRGDLIKGLDGLTEADAMRQWKESLAPQSFRLGKAKAAIQLYQQCVTEQEDVQQHILEDLQRERAEHELTQKKLVAQEQLFADMLQRCALMALSERQQNSNGGSGAGDRFLNDLNDDTYITTAARDNIAREVHSNLLTAASSSESIEGVLDSVRGVSDEYIAQVQQSLDLRAQRQASLEMMLASVNRDLHEAVSKNRELRNKLDRMSSECAKQGKSLEEMMDGEAQLLQRSMSAERKAAGEKRARIKAEDLLAAQSGQVATFVHSMLEACKRHFGYVPPGVKSVSVFYAPRYMKIPVSATK